MRSSSIENVAVCRSISFRRKVLDSDLNKEINNIERKKDKKKERSRKSMNILDFFFDVIISVGNFS